MTEAQSEYKSIPEDPCKIAGVFCLTATSTLFERNLILFISLYEVLYFRFVSTTKPSRLHNNDRSPFRNQTKMADNPQGSSEEQPKIVVNSANGQPVRPTPRRPGNPPATQTPEDEVSQAFAGMQVSNSGSSGAKR